jgi:hypothetical protein
VLHTRTIKTLPAGRDQTESRVEDSAPVAQPVFARTRRLRVPVSHTNKPKYSVSAAPVLANNSPPRDLFCRRLRHARWREQLASAVRAHVLYSDLGARLCVYTYFSRASGARDRARRSHGARLRRHPMRPDVAMPGAPSPLPRTLLPQTLLPPALCPATCVRRLRARPAAAARTTITSKRRLRRDSGGVLASAGMACPSLLADGVWVNTSNRLLPEGGVV